MQNVIYKKFQISESNGFLPDKDPLLILPNYFDSWDSLGRELPHLILAGTLRSELDKTPLLDADLLRTDQELERAMLLLSFFAHAYLRSESEEVFQLPSNIAIPWASVAAKLGRPSVLAHPSAVLNNWRRIDPEQSISINNLALLQQYQGGMDEAWFFLVTVAIEKEGANIVNAIANLLNGKTDSFATHLDTICKSLEEMIILIQRMPEKCDPNIFYTRLRPFLGSLENVVFEGVSPEPINLSGGSAAQSSLIQCIDAVIGIKHEEPRSAGFLLEMRKFMPVKHRLFLVHLENSGLSSTFATSQYHEQLATIKNKLRDFRAEHLKIYHRYVASQQKKTILGDTGTGGTDAIEFLKQTKNDTQ